MRSQLSRLQCNQTVADPAMGGPGGLPSPSPLTKTYGWSWLRKAVCFRPWGKFSFKSLTFVHFFVLKWTKSFQLRLGQGLWRLSPDPPSRHSSASRHRASLDTFGPSICIFWK